MPKFPDPISIVCAGGTSMIGGFTEVFKQEFEKINFPMDVKEIRLAEDPLYSVSKGCLVAALSESV
jgi:actin-related protein